MHVASYRCYGLRTLNFEHHKHFLPKPNVRRLGADKEKGLAEYELGAGERKDLQTGKARKRALLIQMFVESPASGPTRESAYMKSMPDFRVRDLFAQAWAAILRKLLITSERVLNNNAARLAQDPAIPRDGFFEDDGENKGLAIIPCYMQWNTGLIPAFAFFEVDVPAEDILKAVSTSALQTQATSTAPLPIAV